MIKSTVLFIAFALAAHAANVTVFVLAPSFSATRQEFISWEGVAASSAIMQNEALLSMKQQHWTANGQYTMLFAGNTSNPADSWQYLYFPNATLGALGQNATACYAYPFEMPNPLPSTNIGGGLYTRQSLVNGVLLDVYEGDVLQYPRRTMTNAAPDGSVTPFDLVLSSMEGFAGIQQATVNNGTIVPASEFVVPQACLAARAEVQARAARGEPVTRVTGVAARAAMTPPFSSEFWLHGPSVPGVIKFGADGTDVEATRVAFETVLRETGARIGRPVAQYAPSARAARVAAELAATGGALDNRAFAPATRNQGSVCGCCWAMSTVTAAQIVFNVYHNISAPADVRRTTTLYSVQAVIDCAAGFTSGDLFPSKGCFGGWPLHAAAHLITVGAVAEVDYTFDAANGNACKQTPANSFNPISGVSYIPYTGANPPNANNVALIMAGVVEHGAVVVILNSSPPFLFYSGGVLDDPTCTPSLAHAVTVVGFGTEGGKDYWLILNSFGADWGVGGYIKIVRGKNMCGVEQMGFVLAAA